MGPSKARRLACLLVGVLSSAAIADGPAPRTPAVGGKPALLKRKRPRITFSPPPLSPAERAARAKAKNLKVLPVGGVEVAPPLALTPAHPKRGSKPALMAWLTFDKCRSVVNELDTDGWVDLDPSSHLELAVHLPDQALQIYEVDLYVYNYVANAKLRVAGSTPSGLTDMDFMMSVGLNVLTVFVPQPPKWGWSMDTLSVDLVSVPASSPAKVVCEFLRADVSGTNFELAKAMGMQ